MMDAVAGAHAAIGTIKAITMIVAGGVTLDVPIGIAVILDVVDGDMNLDAATGIAPVVVAMLLPETLE